MTEPSRYLLIQKVLIPAIPGNEGNFAGDYVKVLPYYIDDQYPAHGFYVEIINTTAVKELKVVSFDITWPKEKKSAVLTEKDKKKVSRTYDVSPSTAPKANDGSQWDSTPYPKTDVNNFWILGTLKGNVTISLTPQPGQNVLSPVTVPLTIPPRVNIFENTSIHAGNIWYDGEKITYTPAKGSSNSPCYYIISSGEPVKLSDSNNAKDQLEANKGKTLEAYVKVPISSTFVWYRVASVKIDDKFLNP